ncbi:MAG: HIRAN domain-containing protein [Nitrosomonas sp.]|nr:HIRAN domain-containing protein [Nitrosomonas sp.]
MEDESRSSSDPSNSPGTRKTELGVLPILVISLFVGLIAGAGVDKSHILPIAAIVAVVMFINRKKIAAERETTLSGNETENTERTTAGDYVWPKLGQFAFSVAAESFQSAIKQLAQENIDRDDDSLFKTCILKAQLIPDNDNPYDSNAVRIDINNRSVGYLNRDQALGFHRRLEELGISNQVTSCNAMIVKNETVNDNKHVYDVKLDIEPL